jgi:hypothetical protein
MLTVLHCYSIFPSVKQETNCIRYSYCIPVIKGNLTLRAQIALVEKLLKFLI